MFLQGIFFVRKILNFQPPFYRYLMLIVSISDFIKNFVMIYIQIYIKINNKLDTDEIVSNNATIISHIANSSIYSYYFR